MEEDERRIRERIKQDNQTLKHSFSEMASLLGRRRSFASDEVTRRSAHTSVEEICKYYHVPYQENGDHLDDINVQIDRMLRPAGYMHRSVKLKGEWWKECRSPLIGFCPDSKMFVALLPRHFDGYSFLDPVSGEEVKVNKHTASRIREEAIVISRPLPQKSLTDHDVMSFLFSLCNWRDFVSFLMVAILALFFSLVIPWGVQFMLGEIVPTGNSTLVLSLAMALFGFAISGVLAGISKQLIGKRIELGVVGEFRAAVISRLLYLPSAFFSPYSSGELASLVVSLNQMPESVSNVVMGSGISVVLSLVYLLQVDLYASSLLLPAVIILVLEVLVSMIGIKLSEGLYEQNIKKSAKLSAFIYNVYGGIQKIKNSGAEKRAFGMWSSRYHDVKNDDFNRPFLLRYTRFFLMAIASGGNLLLAYLAIKTGVSVTNYVAFMVVFGMMSGAFNSMLDLVTCAVQIRSSLDAARPLLEEVPELVSGKQFVEYLEGKIEVNNISFKYPDQGKKVLDNLSLSIQSGQYVAIVGQTGCGKSTLVKLLLGFLTPSSGAIYYDGKDLNSLDLPSFRSRIGVVLQNGKLFSGDIYSNIAIMDNRISEDEIWSALEIAGVADDIRNMPLGLSTPVSEGAGGLSGGQRQRIMIARALVCHPSMIVFDEAMSALDYRTQKHVSESLEKLHCTRVIVAHRLSTIRQCDKIFVVDDGHIVQSGTFDELDAQGGRFSELFQRQTL